MVQAYAYLLYVLASFVLISIFFAIYTWATPYDEVQLIREGNVAAAVALAGAMIGFSLTLASSVLHSATFWLFLAWAAGALLLQLASYFTIARLLPQLSTGIENNNLAMGILMGTVSLAVGIINAACVF